MKTAKQLIFPAIALLLGPAVCAQSGNETGVQKKEQQMHIKIIREENGKKTVIDTIIDAGNHAALKALQIEIPELPAVPHIPEIPDTSKSTGKKRHIIIETGSNEKDSLMIVERREMKIPHKDCKKMEEEIKMMEFELMDAAKKDKVILIKNTDGTGVDGEQPTRIFIKSVIIKDVTADEKKVQGSKLSGDNNLNVERLNFYPNPGNGKFNLTFELKEKGTTTITIINTEGKKVYEEKLSDFSGGYDKAIDISGSPGGIYFLNVQQGNKNLVKKLVIQ